MSTEGTWSRKKSSEEMAFWLIAELDITPRWRVLKRMHLKRKIKFWTEGI